MTSAIDNANQYVADNLVELCRELEAWSAKGVLPKKARHIRKVVGLLHWDNDEANKYRLAEDLVKRKAIQYVIRTADAK